MIQFKNQEIYYDTKTGLKLKLVVVNKTPRGDVKIPTNFSDYKEVNGVLFSHKREQVTPQFTLSFILKEIKLNEGVTDKDFE